MNRELHIVGFQVGRETYGVPITSLHEIVRVPEITAVPDAPGLHGRRHQPARENCFGHRSAKTVGGNSGRARAGATGFWWWNTMARLSGLIVDSASEVLKIPSRECEPAPHEFQEGGFNCVTGLAKYKGRLIVLLDMAKCLTTAVLREERCRESKSVSWRREAKSAAAAK